MSAELINYCCDQLIAAPRALNIHVPFDDVARKTFSRAWARVRFEAQQQSIICLSPDNPLFGRGYLWPYKLHWTEIPEGNQLRIEYSTEIVPTPRELILLASVSEKAIPFPHSRQVFRSTKYRMLGQEKKRAAGSVIPSLQPAVASVQYSCQGAQATISTVSFPGIVSIEPQLDGDKNPRGAA